MYVLSNACKTNISFSATDVSLLPNLATIGGEFFYALASYTVIRKQEQ